MKQHLFSGAIYGLTSAIGLLAFVYPFLGPALQDAGMGQSHTNDAPLLLTALVSLCFVALLLEVQGQAIGAKLVALLGVLVSMNALLRFIEVAIPGPGGFSPVFALIVLTGYVYGGRFGFLMGVLTLVVGALITGGVGPWLPYQMLTAGWAGLTMPLCRPLVGLVRGVGKRREVLIVAAVGGIWGWLYGAVMNIWFWPFLNGPDSQSWQPGMSLADTLTRYAAFYLATSLVWDTMRAVGNVVLILAFGMPVLRALRRFHQRFSFSYEPAYEQEPTA